MMAEPVFFTVEEVAEVIRILPEAVRRKIRAGEIRAFKIGRRWLIRHDEMQRLQRGLA